MSGEGEFYARFVELLESGYSLVHIVRELKVPPEKVIEAYNKYRKLLELERMRREQEERFKLLLKDIQEAEKYLEKLRREIRELEARKKDYELEIRRLAEKLKEVRVGKYEERARKIKEILERVETK